VLGSPGSVQQRGGDGLLFRLRRQKTLYTFFFFFFLDSLLNMVVQQGTVNRHGGSWIIVSDGRGKEEMRAPQNGSLMDGEMKAVKSHHNNEEKEREKIITHYPSLWRKALR
jgi:hypothetical protein